MHDQSITIPLTQGKYAIIDADDYERVSQYKWHAFRSKNTPTWYASTTLPSPLDRKKRPTMRLHRFIMGVTDPAIHIDHRNRDGLDNRKSNLRPATVAQNDAWRIPHGHLYRGVRQTKSGAWECRVSIRLGPFKTAEEAARAYDEVARSLYGEFAYLNYPE